MRKHVRHTKECALFRLEIFFRLQKQYLHEYPRNGERALSLTLLLSDPELPEESAPFTRP